MDDADEFLAEQREQFAVLSEEERQRAKEIAHQFVKIADDSSFHGILKGISEKAFDLEKKSLPQVASISDEQRPDVLILTVGMTSEPVILSLLSVRRVWLTCYTPTALGRRPRMP